jgi:hypothetical protein
MSELEEKSQDKNVSYIIIQKTCFIYGMVLTSISQIIYFSKKPGACTYKYGIYMNFK